MIRLRLGLLAVFITCSLIERPSRAAGPAGKLPVDPAPWVNLSDPIVQKLKAEGKKFGFSGETAGVAVDVASGDIFMIVNGQGIWSNQPDGGKTFASDDGKSEGNLRDHRRRHHVETSRKVTAWFLDAQGRLVRQHHLGSRERDLLRLTNGQADVQVGGREELIATGKVDRSNTAGVTQL